MTRRPSRWLRGPILSGASCAALALALPVEQAAGQSLLDRPPNVSGDWVANSGTVQFNFLHRFTRSDAPERKVSNFPTFLMGLGLPARLMVGFQYATNSTLAPRYPNEWEFFARYAPLSQYDGAPIDVGTHVGYNLAAEGVDAEVSLARRVGFVRLLGVGRLLADPFEAGNTRFALGGGGILRLSRHLALAGDVASIVHPDSARGERVAWSAGLHLAIPNTPHTLSLQVTNTNTSTLQGLSRGGSDVRYGFEFTIPITLARYFGRRPSPTPPAPVPVVAPGDSIAPTPDGAHAAPVPPDTSVAKPVPPAPAQEAPAARPRIVRARIRSMAFAPARIVIDVGTTVEWRNDDPLAHTVTANDRSFDSGLIDGGRTWRHTFTRPGTHPFFCLPHPFMQGVVVVRGAR